MVRFLSTTFIRRFFFFFFFLSFSLQCVSLSFKMITISMVSPFILPIEKSIICLSFHHVKRFLTKQQRTCRIQKHFYVSVSKSNWMFECYAYVWFQPLNVHAFNYYSIWLSQSSAQFSFQFNIFFLFLGII